jgi:hypothetical protein
MKASVEIYKGIEFVRLSSLSDAERASINNSTLQAKLIKIAKNDELLVDCLLYNLYLAWYDQNHPAPASIRGEKIPEKQSLVLR